MTSAEVTYQARRAHLEGHEVSTPVARAIAGYWHAGQGSAFYAFTSSGHYDRDALLRELSDTIAAGYSSADADDRLQLDMLGTYLLNRPQEYAAGNRVQHADDERTGTVVDTFADGRIVRVQWDDMTNGDGTPFVTDCGAVALVLA